MDDERLRDIIAPSVESRIKVRRYVNDYAYYAIIVIVSLIGMFVPPLCFGCINGDAGMNFPKTTEGWILWGVMTGSVSMANVSILVMFKNQAKKNVRHDPNYKEANRILNKVAGKSAHFIPRSPSQVNARDYVRKGMTIVAGTVASFMAVAPLILSFDVVTLVSTCISVSVSLCTSWACMIRNEEYWTEEYLLYAKMVEAKIAPKDKKGENEDDLDRRKELPEHPGESLAEQPGDQRLNGGDQNHGQGPDAPGVA